MDTKHVLAGGALAVALFTATPAFADSDKRGDDRFEHRSGFLVRLFDEKRGDDDRKERSTVHAMGQVTAISGSTLTLQGKNGASYTVNAAQAEFEGAASVLGDIAVGDTVKVSGELSGSVIVAKEVKEKKVKQAMKRFGDAAAGIVTSVAGSTFVIDTFGSKPAATVTTNASTTFKVNGIATTSTALRTGDAVVVFGSTTASSTGGTLMTATIVHIISDFWNKLERMLTR